MRDESSLRDSPDPQSDDATDVSLTPDDPQSPDWDDVPDRELERALDDFYA